MLEIQTLHHLSIVVKDVKTSTHFYCNTLGMNDVPRPANLNFEGAWLRKGSAEIHLIQANEAVQEAGDRASYPTERRDVTFARHFCFQINDLDEMLKVLKEHCIPIAAGPRPRGDGAMQTYIYDPDGHMIELVYVP